MERNFWIPFALSLTVVVLAVLFGYCSVAGAIRLVLVVFSVLSVGKKTRYNFAYMWLAGVSAFAICFVLFVGLMELGDHIPWIRTAMLWPTN